MKEGAFTALADMLFIFLAIFLAIFLVILYLPTHLATLEEQVAPLRWLRK